MLLVNPLCPATQVAGFTCQVPLRGLATAYKGGFADGARSFQLLGGVNQQYLFSPVRKAHAFPNVLVHDYTSLLAKKPNHHTGFSTHRWKGRNTGREPQIRHSPLNSECSTTHQYASKVARATSCQVN